MSDKPIRIQLSRTKGWRMPHNTVKAARPSIWGKNPFKAAGYREAGYRGTDAELHAACVNAFRAWLAGSDRDWMGPQSEAAREAILSSLPELRGKNLACWCQPGSPCHADVLLDIANA